MIVFVGSDHRGFEAKKHVIAHLQKRSVECVDVGDERLLPDDDFPVFAAKAVTAIKTSEDKDPRAILLCGSGQGMMMAANRFKGIRAGLGWSVEAAEGIRNDEDSNVLAMPAELFEKDLQLAHAIIDAFLVLHVIFAVTMNSTHYDNKSNNNCL
jgi:ribose 5-phosphate isomerase B